jgi:transcriptional regulator with XRE-family HTH domain
VPPEERFGANARRLRKAAGLSQMELFDRSGLHMSEISRLERGIKEPRLTTMPEERPAVLREGLRVVDDRLPGGGDLEDPVAVDDVAPVTQMLSPTWNAVPICSSPAGVSTAT